MTPPPTHTPDSASTAQLWFQAAGIFAAAVAFGVIYNGTSPLGVRPHAAAVRDADSAAVGVVPSQPAVPRQGYFNETLSMTLEAPVGNALQPSGNPSAPAVVAPQPVISSLTWPQVQALFAAHKIVVVDARTKVAYDLGHIPGALWLSSNASAPELQAFAARYGKATALVVYCGSTTCRASQQLARQLVAVGGFTRVSEMPGGFAEYTLAQTSPPQTHP